MRRVVRRAVLEASQRTSPKGKRAIKATAKRVLPSGARARVKARIQRVLRGGWAQGPAGSTPPESKLLRDVGSMSRALWMGFETDATTELERMRRMILAPPRPLARAAETLARWYTTKKEYEPALERVVHARTLNGELNPERLRILEHHLLTELGHFDEAERLFTLWGEQSPDLHLMQANLRLRQAEAGLLTREQADRERLELIDFAFHARAMRTLSELLGSAEQPLNFAALAALTPDEVAPGAATGPLISIVVPAYNAEDTLATSVNSLRAQTHTNVEILVVDDASTDNTAAVAKDLADLDGRVKVLRHEQNQGAYGARNTGLYAATGELFTVHDADDWSHPQMLTCQLAELEQHPEAVGSFSRLARVTPDLEFLLRPYRRMLEPIHWNYTSLLVRTERMRAFGGWDTVRAHADAEFIDRLRSHHGKNALVEAETTVPLSFFLVTGGNLTERKDTGLRSVDFGSRREYSEQAKFWRARNFADGEIPSLAEHRRNGARSPFFTPRSLAPNRDQISRTYDLVIGSDLALKGGTRRCNLAYVDCATELGLRVGIFNAPRYRLKGMGSIDPEYRELLERDNVDLLGPEDKVTTRTLLLHHPPVLRSDFVGYPTVTAERHYLLVNQLPWEMTDFTGVQYDATEVHQRFESKFGAEPQWIPITPRVRQYLKRVLPDESLYGEDWYPIVNWKTAKEPRKVRGSAPPVIGRHSRDHATKWPENSAVLEQSYLVGTEFEVQLLGGSEAAEAILGYRPKNWVVHPFDSISVLDFLAGIDIFVHFHHSTYIEEFGRNIAEAMALGIPCILPPEYKETFRDAALYAEPADVATTIKELWADPERFAVYSRRGIAFVEEYSGMAAGERRVRHLLP